MSFNFQVDKKEQFIIPKQNKYRYASNKYSKEVLYHRSFRDNVSNNTKNYEALEKVGKGGASSVYKGVDNDTGKEIIIKELKTANLSKLIREVNILTVSKGIKHVVPLIDFFKNSDVYYLVFPYLKVEQTRAVFYKFSRIEIKVFMYKFLETIDKLHAKGVIHRDLKPGNLLVKSCTDFYIIDFGISDFYLPFRNFCTKIGTRNFKAPEQLIGIKGFDYGIDVWAVGVMFAEMLFQKFPFWPPEEDIVTLENICKMTGTDKFDEFLDFFKIKEKYNFIENVKNKNPTPLKKYNQREPNDNIYKDFDDAIDLLEKMLEINPLKRINAKDTLKHKYFQELFQTEYDFNP